MRLPKHTGPIAACILLGVTGSVALGAGWQRAETGRPEPVPTVTVSTAPVVMEPEPAPTVTVTAKPKPVTTNSLPHCVNDDYNDGSQALCWSSDVDGLVFVIDKTDTVVSRGEDTDLTTSLPACGGGLTGWCVGTDDSGQYVLSPDDVQYHAG